MVRKHDNAVSVEGSPVSLLVTFLNPSAGRDYWIEHVAPEFTSVCPVTGQPDFGTVRVKYVADKLCVELKSYKLYLQSFRSEGIFYEAVTNRILDDLVKVLQPRSMTVVTEWTPRGGLHSVVTASYERAGEAEGEMMGADILTEKRLLGRTGFQATRLGIGDLADRNLPLEECVATAVRALDAGLNVIDTAPGYEDGFSEEIVGKALAGRREGVFLIDKIDALDEPVAGQVDQSLRRLGVEEVDLFVLHGLSTLEGWAKAAADGGAMEQLGECRRAGKLRFRGISCHAPAVLREAIPSGLCDVVMFSVGAYVDAAYVEEILPLARKCGVGVVSFKTFGAGKLLGDTLGYQRPLTQRPRRKISSGGVEVGEAVLPRLSVDECMGYTLSCDPDVALLGMSFVNEQEAAFSAARAFAGKYSEERMADIQLRAIEAVRGKGPCWWNPDPHAHA